MFDCINSVSDGLVTLRKLFNIITTTECMPSARKNSIMVPIFKGKVTFNSVRFIPASNCSHTPSKYGRRWSTEGWESAGRPGGHMSHLHIYNESLRSGNEVGDLDMHD